MRAPCRFCGRAPRERFSATGVRLRVVPAEPTAVTVDAARIGQVLGNLLTIARALAEAHGGSLSAASAGPGCGAQFTVCLPAR